MAIRVFDCWYHDQDIREALDRPGYLEGPVADLSLARIPPKGLPYVVGKKAGAPPGATVVFDVAGEPPIVAAVRAARRPRAVCSTRRPTTRRCALAMDRRTFARLAGGRWTGDKARAERRRARSTATRSSATASSTTWRSRSSGRVRFPVMKALLYGVKPEPMPEPDTDNHLLRNLAHTPMSSSTWTTPGSCCPTGS